MKILRITTKIVSALFYYVISRLIPKDKNLWVFGSWKGKNYSDNSKELFKYVNRINPKIKAVWIAKNDNVFDEVTKAGYKVQRYPSLKAYWTVMRAGVNVQTESNEDTGKYRVGGACIIQLFHGYGAVKEAHLYPNMGKLKKKLVKIYADNHTTSNWMVPSVYFYNRLPELFDTNKSRTYITGQPRIDLLYENIEVRFFEQKRKKYANNKFLFYAPTHRNYAQGEKKDFSHEEWSMFNSFCEENNFVCFFKPHPLEVERYAESFKSFSRIILLSNKISDCPSDPYEYMHYFDLIISDYSSISTDYLVFDRPVVHFMYDIDSFADKSFTLDALDTFKAGPICKTWSEVYDSIKESFDSDPYKDTRRKARNVAFDYVDNNNCKRVYETIMKITHGAEKN